MRICDRFWSFLKGRSPLLGWKHPRSHILKGKSLKKKKIEEEEMGLSLKIVYFHPLSFFSLSFDGFLSHRDVLGFVLRFFQNLTALVWISLIFIFI